MFPLRAIVEASEQVPLLAMLLRVDMSIVREILNREELPGAETSGNGAALPSVRLRQVC